MKNLDQFIIESEQQKPYIDTLPLVETLSDGLYEGQNRDGALTNIV